TKEVADVEPGTFVHKVNTSFAVDWKHVKSVSEQDSAVVVDVRSPEQFDQGHIPGAINIPIEDLMEGNPKRWKDSTELKQLLADHEISKRTPVVTTCNTGRQGTQMWFTLKHFLGFSKVTVYEGSWMDWKGRGISLTAE
ncbi:MAG: hypothetical protein IID44_26300, partial [Planctomycetes bacterium]|nr:hypothetical protein [Planctomycetota bacterium]